MVAINDAFDAFRNDFPPPLAPRNEFIRNQDECVQLTPENGLLVFHDGPNSEINSSEAEVLIMATLAATPYQTHLWAVTDVNVSYANENCPFGRSLESARLTHTNLTGGGEAYCGGEVLIVEEGMIVLNGKSGRYPVRSAEQMNAVAKAFSKAGYNVWSMGFDAETAMPLPFGATTPRLVK